MTNTSPLALLLEPEQLAPHINNNNLLILDVCSADSYAKHHIPNAVHISPSALQCGIPPVPGKLPDAEQLTTLFSNVGLSANKHVIVYDDEGGGWAGRLIWTLDVLTHHNYSYINGGIHAWIHDGLPTQTAPADDIKRSDFKAQIDTQVIASLDQIIHSLGNTDTAIWDARSKEEYNGSKVVSKHGGHIPGAINIDWLELIDCKRNMRLVDLQQLQQRLNQQNISKDKCIITHCQTHHRSGLSYLAMKILGYPNIKGYDGSWSEWGNRDDTPIEK